MKLLIAGRIELGYDVDTTMDWKIEINLNMSFHLVLLLLYKGGLKPSIYQGKQIPKQFHSHNQNAEERK